MINKPRILYIATFPPPVHGSAVVSQQIKESKLINEAFDGDYVNIATSRGLDEKNNYLVKLGRFIASFSKTFWLLLSRHYDLCYCAITCHGGCFLRDAPYVLLCKLFRRKVVIHQHNKGMSRDVDRPVFRWLYPLVYNNVKVILLSWYLYPDIEKVVKRENVMICPNGIKPTADPNFVHTPNKVPHILFLSNLLIDKGVLVLLDALKILKDKGYSFICDFVGSETREISAQRFTEEVESRGLNQIAVYHGRKYGNDKAEFFEKADVFAFPTFYSNECFPLVNLEAMDYKLPIVTTDVGGIQDEVVDGVNGFAMKPNDKEPLADALRKLLDDSSLRQKMGENGYRIFKSKFTDECFEGLITKQLNDSWGGVKINLVNFWGRRIGKEKDIFWQDADMFVFPSMNEAFGLVAVEAMEYGIPVIASNEGGIPEVVENGVNGLLVEKNNSISIAEAITKLITDSSLRIQMGQHGRKKFQEKFTEEYFEKTMVDCLKQCIVSKS